MNDIPVKVNFGNNENFTIAFDGDFSVDYSQMHRAGDYMGAYTFTPTNEAQEIETSNKILTQNIIIEPIPSNYGLVTWNGSALTIA